MRLKPLAAAVDDLRDARRHAFATLKAEPFDEAAAAEAFAAVREKTDALQRLGQAIVIDAVKAAPPEARARITVPGG
jgi:Spy/CpxP family protein refolding chaperone